MRRSTAVTIIALVYISATLSGRSFMTYQRRQVPDPCAVPRLAQELLRIAGQPGGIEYLAQAGLCQRNVTTPAIVHQTLRLPEALNDLVLIDPRYSWKVYDGVYVVRPVDQLENPNHYLNQRAPLYEMSDQDVSEVSTGLASYLSGITIDARDRTRVNMTPQMSRRISFRLEQATILEILNTIVRQHGALAWDISYCKPQYSYAFATIWLRTFDHGGEGHHTAVRSDDGTSKEWCDLKRP